MKLKWNLADEILEEMPKGPGQLSFHHTRPSVTAAEHGRTIMKLDPETLTLWMPEKEEISLEGLAAAKAQGNELVLTYEDDTTRQVHASRHAGQIAHLLQGLLSHTKPVQLTPVTPTAQLEADKRYDKEAAALAVTEITAQQLYDQSKAYGQVNDRASEWNALTRAAELSHPDAHFQLATYLATGMYGHKADPAAAYHHMEQAAHLGHKDAPYYLANWNRTGFGTDKNLEQAVLWYKQDESPKALTQLALLYGDELHDTEKAVEAATRALAMTKVAKTREILTKKLDLWSLPENHEEKEILQAFRTSQAQAHPAAPLKVTAADLMEQAAQYAQVEDRESEWNCLVRAAELSHPKAHYQLATYLATGMYGHPADPETAFEHMRDAADLGNPDAAYYLGSWSRNGFGTEKDLDQAEFWLKKDNTLKGKIQLALLYGDDRQEPEKAIALADEILGETKVDHTTKVMTARKAKWRQAQDALKLASGRNLRIAHVLNDAKEYDLAAEFLEKAAPYSVEAKYLLGLLYLKGQGVPADKEKAREYLEAAADLQPDSLYYLTYLENDQNKAREYGEKYLEKGTNEEFKEQVRHFLHPESPESLRRKGLEKLQSGDESGLDLLKQAADGNDETAKLLWAEAMLDKEPEAAVKILKEEADKGVPDAMALMAYAYANGLGVARDAWKAQWLLQRAASRGSRLARQWITRS